MCVCVCVCMFLCVHLSSFIYVRTELCFTVVYASRHPKVPQSPAALRGSRRRIRKPPRPALYQDDQLGTRASPK